MKGGIAAGGSGTFYHITDFILLICKQLAELDGFSCFAGKSKIALYSFLHLKITESNEIVGINQDRQHCSLDFIARYAEWQIEFFYIRCGIEPFGVSGFGKFFAVFAPIPFHIDLVLAFAFDVTRKVQLFADALAH